MSDHKDSRLFAYLQLVRLPNLFTAMADVTMGFLFVHGLVDGLLPNELQFLILLPLASASLYAGGVVLNDVFDYLQDIEERPERPLPSQRISRRTARWLGTNLLILGVLLGVVVAIQTSLVRPVVVVSLLAACILLYNAWAKSTLLGPVVMGACRTLNVLFGMSVGGRWLVEHWVVALAIGTYIAGVTWLARTETRRSRRLHLIGATIVIFCGIGLLASLPHWMARPFAGSDSWYILMGFLGLMIGWRCLFAIADPRSIVVQSAVKQSIVTLIMLDAAACYAKCGPEGAMLVMLFLIPTIGFGQWIRAT